MPLQNRVDPWGKLIATSARGVLLGNRGILHNNNQEIVKPWAHKAWINCTLSYAGVQRQVFSPNSYSELFFLDEATALSAGHRPCAKCRRERFHEFKLAWCTANRGDAEAKLTVQELDKQLHEERAIRGGSKLTHLMPFAELPDGVFFEWQGEALLCWQGVLKKWSPTGYSTATSVPAPADLVKVLTPISIVKMYSYLFRPQVHESAETN
ncbi:MAG: hypothetical protein ACH34X_19085 [Thiolinea sp.]